MRVTLLAKRYAQALFDLAIETKSLEKVAKDMALISAVIEENRELKLMLRNPVLDSPKKNNVLSKVFKAHIEELSLRFLLLITRKGRERYIQYIATAFSDIYKEYKNIVDVQLTSAYETDKAIKDSVLKVMSSVTDKSIDLSEIIDEDIIGGFLINMEDYQYDASVKTQLKRLRKEFSKNLYIKKY